MFLAAPGPIEGSPLQLDDVPAPTPSAGEVSVQVRCCAICHTDLHICEGELPLPRLPVIPGHQIVGIVDQLGNGVRTLKEGDRVGIPWLHSTDQTCEYCRKDLENLCENARFTGYHANGGYAENAVIHEDYAYRLPEAFSDENAAPLLCAGVIGYRSYRLTGVRPGAVGSVWLRRISTPGASASASSGVRDLRLHARGGASRIGNEVGCGLDWTRRRHSPATARRCDHFRPGGRAGSARSASPSQRRHACAGGNHDE